MDYHKYHHNQQNSHVLGLLGHQILCLKFQYILQIYICYFCKRNFQQKFYLYVYHSTYSSHCFFGSFSSRLDTFHLVLFRRIRIQHFGVGRYTGNYVWNIDYVGDRLAAAAFVCLRNPFVHLSSGQRVKKQKLCAHGRFGC